jgi:hypothetical protein
MIVCLLFLCISLFLVIVTKNSLLPDSSTVVYEGQARFIVLSAQLIRLEWSRTKEFVNAKT